MVQNVKLGKIRPAHFNRLEKKIAGGSQNLKSLAQKTKIWHNNVISRRFGKYSFDTSIQNQSEAVHSGRPQYQTCILPEICHFWVQNVKLGKNRPSHFNGLEKTQLEPKFEVSSSKDKNLVQLCNLQKVWKILLLKQSLSKKEEANLM